MTLHGRRAWTEKTPPPTEPLALGGRGQEGRGQPEAQRGRGEHVESPASNSPCLPPPAPASSFSAYCYSRLRMSVAQRETCINMCKESCK